MVRPIKMSVTKISSSS